MGYAFINLVNTKYIKDLYREFNGKRWRKFNSEKICEVCYARLQGTDQLLNHFRYSNVFQQRDWRLKPLIYLNLEVGLTNGEELSQQPPTSLWLIFKYLIDSHMELIIFKSYIFETCLASLRSAPSIPPIKSKKLINPRPWLIPKHPSAPPGLSPPTIKILTKP